MIAFQSKANHPQTRYTNMLFAPVTLILPDNFDMRALRGYSGDVGLPE